MTLDLLIEPHVDAIRMPENLRVGLMVAEARKKCDYQCDGDFVSFAFGQSPFQVPAPLVLALTKYADRGHYSEAEGIPELRKAIAGFNKRHFNLDIDPKRVVVGSGTKDLIHIIFDIISGGIVIPSPSWIGYSPQVKLLDKHFHTFYQKPENGYKIQPEELDRFLSALDEQRHILVLNSPHNPTGLVYTGDELEAVADVCRRHNTPVLADEIYALTTYDISSFTSMASVYPEGTFLTNGLSKDRSAGGYRLGYCILPEGCGDDLIAAFRKVAATIYTNVSTPTQWAAVTAYEPNAEIEEYFNITRDIHRMMGKYFSAEFNTIDGITTTVPEGGFYFFADFNALADDLRRNGVADSNALAHSLIDHPYHFAAVTGDACLLRPDDYGARIAFVDYDGAEAFENYKINPPKTEAEEVAFIKENAPFMIKGLRVLKDYIAAIKSN